MKLETFCIIVLWTIIIGLTTTFVYAFTLGAGQLGTNALGVEGPTTTSTYVPGRERNAIIGGGIVKLEKKYMESTNGEEIVLFLQTKIGEEELE